MANELCMSCFNIKGKYDVCPYCGYADGTPPKQPHHLMPGTILQNHIIIGTVIGSGGFGIIYKCFDMTLGVIVAVKEFYPAGLVNRAQGDTHVGLLSGDKQEQFKVQLDRFLMEARSIAQFDKANDIVNVNDFFEENGTAYIVMEYVEGVLLEEYLEKQGRLSPKIALNIAMLIIGVVKKIHSKGIIHRDISPDNIFILNEDSIKIFDFGAAILNDSKEGSDGEEIIKMGYSAPEQYRHKNGQGFFTDVYSTGAILYHMLTGIKPIEATEREHKDNMKSPLELGVKISSNTDRAIMEALAVRSELRFQGIQQFEEALRNKRTAEYPKDKLKKRRHKRNWIIGTAVTMVAAVIVGLGLYTTVLKPSSEIFESTIKKDTSINVWVENEYQQKIIEDLVKEGLKQGDLSVALQRNPERWIKFWKENEFITVRVSVHEDMQRDLIQASDEEYPNMYVTDHVSDPNKKNLISLEGIYNEIDEDEYAYMSEYVNYFPGYTEMPTGLDTLLLYTCNISYDKDMGLENKSAIFADEKDKTINQETVGAAEEKEDNVKSHTVELKKLISDESGKYEIRTNAETMVLSNKLAYFEKSAVAYALELDEVKEWGVFFSLEKEFIPNTSTLEKIQNFNAIAHKPKYMVSISLDGEGEYTGAYGNNIVAGAAYRKTMEAALEKKDNTNMTNRLEGYETYVITDDGKMLVEFSERYGITRQSDISKEIACKRLLYIMLQAPAQDKKNTYNKGTVFPIRKEQLQEFQKIKRNMQDFSKLYEAEYPCVILGSETGNMSDFVDHIDIEMMTRKDLQDYCSNYIKKLKEENKEK